MNSFKIINKIGEGTYSTVYIVKRYEDGEIYALKKVKMNNLSYKEKINALNEVRILASVKSDFVISYKESFIDESDQTLCLVMEYADEGDLFQKITFYKKMKTSFSEEEVWKIFIQITKGLSDLHRYGILHRDLKSANIFLFKNGKAKLGDLNVSKIATRGLGCTQTGTPYYASPEIWKDVPYDLKSDIWSLGCIAYELAMLKTPFRAQTMDGLYKKVMKGEYPSIGKKYSEKYSDVVKRMLKVKVEDRPTTNEILSMPEVLEKIEELNIFISPYISYTSNNNSMVKEASSSNISSNRDNVYSNNSKITYNVSNSILLSNSQNPVNKSCVINNNGLFRSLKLKYNLNDKAMEMLNILDRNCQAFVSLKNEEKRIELETIRVPRRLGNLNEKLPESKYEDNSVKNYGLKSDYLGLIGNRKINIKKKLGALSNLYNKDSHKKIKKNKINIINKYNKDNKNKNNNKTDDEDIKDKDNNNDIIKMKKGNNIGKILKRNNNFNDADSIDKLNKISRSCEKSNYRSRIPSFNTLKMKIHKSRPFNRKGKIDIIVEEEDEGEIEQNKFKKVKSVNLMKNINNIYGTYCPKIYKFSNGELKLNLNDETILGNLNYSMNTDLMKGDNKKLKAIKPNEGFYHRTESINNILPIIRYKNI